MERLLDFQGLKLVGRIREKLDTAYPTIRDSETCVTQRFLQGVGSQDEDLLGEVLLLQVGDGGLDWGDYVFAFDGEAFGGEVVVVVVEGGGGVVGDDDESFA